MDKKYVVEIGFGSESKDMSKGQAEVSLRVRFDFLVSSFVDGRIYPVVARAG